MEKNDNIIMSRYAFERMQTKDEISDKWRNITIILLIVFLVVTNAMWLIAWNSCEFVSDEIKIHAGENGHAFYIGNDGEINDSANDTQGKSEAQG